jgi:hypothetical protein
MAEQITLSFQQGGLDESLDPMNTTYCKLDLHKLIYDSITRASNRVISGTDLCGCLWSSAQCRKRMLTVLDRNEPYVQNAMAFTRMVPYISAILSMMPRVLRP